MDKSLTGSTLFVETSFSPCASQTETCGLHQDPLVPVSMVVRRVWDGRPQAPRDAAIGPQWQVATPIFRKFPGFLHFQPGFHNFGTTMERTEGKSLR